MWNLITDKVSSVLIVVLTVVLIIISLYSYIATVELDNKSEELAKIRLVIDNRVDEVKQEVRTIEKEVIKIQKIYVPKTEYITKFIKVENETDCNASNRLIHDFEF